MPGAPVIFDLTMLAEIVANGMMIDGVVEGGQR